MSSERRFAELERRLAEVEAQRERDNAYFSTQIEQLKSRVHALEGEQARTDFAKRCDDEAARELLDNDLSAQLRAKMWARDLTLRQTAAEIKVSASTLSRAQRGSRLTLETWRAINLWLGLDVGVGKKIPTSQEG